MNKSRLAAAQIEGKKARGAYYTSRPVADFLVRWAIRNSADTVLDPSFGGGIFLDAASRRLRELKGYPESQIFGVELDPQTHRTVGEGLTTLGVSQANLFLSDFFDLEPLPVNQVNAIVGNPPFIRYQRFRDAVRRKALQRADENGVTLSQLSSSWAPFLIHSVSMLKPHGRLAMVLPAELGYANYAAPVLKFLVRSFSRVTILTFKEKLFPHLSEDTLLLLANDRGGKSDQILHRDFEKVSSLASVSLSKNHTLYRTKHVDVESMLSRSARLIEYLLPAAARDLYLELRNSDRTINLGELADVGIGYVTGANDFFHLTPDEVAKFNIPKHFLRRAVRRGRALSGLGFTEADWRRATVVGDGGYLLYINGHDFHRESGLANYLRIGKDAGVADAYKCRVRDPWYSVPHVHTADGFLTYMSGNVPRLVVNHASAVAPNTLHVLRLRNSKSSARSIAALWNTSLSRLSAEIEGHAMGGGMLKLEPSEASKVLLASTSLTRNSLEGLHFELDRLVRGGEETKARELADREILQKHLGLSNRDCLVLKQGWNTLLARRLRKRL